MGNHDWDWYSNDSLSKLGTVLMWVIIVFFVVTAVMWITLPDTARDHGPVPITEQNADFIAD